MPDTTERPVPPMHYAHCLHDTEAMMYERRRPARDVVEKARAQGVSVWAALAGADLPYIEKAKMAEVWAANQRGSAADRAEYFQ